MPSPTPSHLHWNGRTGLAQHDGVTITLHHSPGPAWAAVDYTQGLQAQVRDHASSPRRDMLAAEVAQVERWLAYMAHAARNGIGQGGAA
jgi:hypothetical protein